MKTITAALMTASLALGLLGGANAASKSRRHHHRATHHRSMSHRTMSMGARRTAVMSHTTPRQITNGHGPTRHHGHGVYGGVFSEPTVTNNGQASGNTPPSGVNGTGTDKAGGAR